MLIINVQTNNSKGNKKSQQFSLNMINSVKNRGKDSLIRTEFVPILNKSIPPVIEVFKDKTLKKGEEIEQFIFLIGSRVEEVTTSIFAISKLLHPYK